MKPIRLSVALNKVKGARMVQMSNPEGKKQIYAAIPIDQLFVPANTSDAYLIMMAIETPNSLYSDFVLKEYVEQKVYDGMTPEERMSIATLGRGRIVKERPNKVLINNVESVDESGVEDYVQHFDDDGFLK